MEFLGMPVLVQELRGLRFSVAVIVFNLFFVLLVTFAEAPGWIMPNACFLFVVRVLRGSNVFSSCSPRAFFAESFTTFDGSFIWRFVSSLVQTAAASPHTPGGS